MIWYPNDVGNLHINIHQPRLFWVVNFQTEPYAGCLWMPVECSAASWTCWTCGTRFPFCGPSVGKMSGIGPWFFDGLTTDNQIQSICSVHGLPRRVSEITRNQHCILLHGSRKKEPAIFVWYLKTQGQDIWPQKLSQIPAAGCSGEEFACIWSPSTVTTSSWRNIRNLRWLTNAGASIFSIYWLGEFGNYKMRLSF